ncbi:TRADD-N-associated membrane domain-containing protein [Lacrimispora amygdalina]|uniref:TRADD-N-associated membrane domain-containing protein n=1 Tax=Lacrimispora amygdalina TaxID=253257 RepID=UPI000BE27DCE|nr:hypothetical protein [Lacrimispora amygdalina]
MLLLSVMPNLLFLPLIIVSILLVTITFISVTIYEKQTRSSEKILKEMFLNNEISDKEDSIKHIMTNIPAGLSEEDFFNRLKKELLEISYLQIKSPDKAGNEKSVYLLLEKHHQQALQQSNVQFWFSILAAIVGFITIIFSVFVFSNINWYDYVLKTIPSIVMEAVSFLFFNQARETRDRATKFFKELNYEKQIAKSVAIADTIESEEIKSKVKSQIALRIIGINETE